MKFRLLSKILIGIIALALILVFVLAVFVEPWVERKILSTLNENNKGYLIKAEVVDFSIFKSGLELKNITITAQPESGADRYLNGKIASIRIKGISMLRILFKNGIYLREVIISRCNIDGRIPFPKKTTPPLISDQNIRIGCIIFDTLDLSLKFDSTARSYSIKKGQFKLVNLQIDRKDTISPAIINEVDITSVEDFSIVSADSLYSFKIIGIRYAADIKTLEADSLSIHPNYPDYDFASLHEFQADRIEAALSHIYIKSFSPTSYFKSGDLNIASIDVGELKLNVFRDKRKKFRHTNKPVFQEMIKSYPGNLHIDSIRILSGNITYAEHTPGASEQGKISFEELRASIHQITNDTLYKKEKGYFQLYAQALLMGKGKLSVSLKARLFENNDPFTLAGTLSEMNAEALNPMLEYTAYIYATSGKIDAMDFNFTADNTKATGKMTLRYHGLDIAVKNKQTNDTTALKERIISIIANTMILNSNPLPGEEVREGVIYYERDPERFIFGYAFRSILSGMKSSLLKNQEKEK
ncbi:MAG: hypothetical protein HGA37_15755 [Lentimicrobium sp.]|nr:hypothetical protein [Lentimicrobium sp.]